jgi:hypothetical protein
MREVEGLVLVMPFALLSASSTWTWVGLKNDGFFAGDQVWDQELFTSRGMQLYEILYGFEIYSLLFSLLSIAGDPVSVEDVSLTTLSVTLSLLYFFAYSRSRSQAFAENVFGIMLLASMSCVLGIFLIAHMRVCGIQQSAAAVAVTLVLCLSLTHVSNKDEMHAGSVILLRTLFSCVASLYFVVLSAANSNSVCVWRHGRFGSQTPLRARAVCSASYTALARCTLHLNSTTALLRQESLHSHVTLWQASQ